MRVREVPHAVGGGLAELAIGRDRAIAWPQGRWRWVRWPVRILVAAATVLITPALMISIDVSHPHAAPGLVALMAVGQLLPLPLVLRYPLWGWRIGLLAALLVPLAPDVEAWGNWPWDPVQIPLLGLAFISAGLRHRRAVLWWMWAFMMLALWLYVDVGDATGAAVLLTIVTALVDTIGSRSRAQRALVVETERSELEKARRTVLEERTRIARELHDVVAHHMSLIAVQAETARYRRDDVSAGAAEEFASISSQARDALHEMRRLLGVLRSEDTALRVPQPGLADLEALVDSTRRAGVTVRLTLRGMRTPVPEALGVCVYRVVQEAISNATRHAAGADVDVSVEVTGRRVDLRVHNGAGAGPRSPVGPTHGLVGMRERVALLGGELHTGPTPDGGFTVTATVPVAGGDALV
ncbi:MAG: sensor histidine kinase [Actinocatenispora sp.]